MNIIRKVEAEKSVRSQVFWTGNSKKFPNLCVNNRHVIMCSDIMKTNARNQNNLVDRLIMIFMVALFFVAAFLIYDETYIFSYRSFGTSLGRPVGKIVEIQNDVRKKFVSDISWFPTNTKDRVISQEMIFVGENSTTKIALDSGETISLGPNSLIMLEDTGENQVLTLKRGVIRGELSNKTTLAFSKNGVKHVVNSKKANVVLNVGRDGNVELELLSGNVKVNNSKKEFNLDRPSILNVKGADSEKSRILEIISPKNEQNFITQNPELEFSWKKLGDEKSYRLKISSSNDFRNILYNKTTSQNSERWAYPRTGGRFYWQVEAMNGQEIIAKSFKNRFQVFYEDPPRLDTPVDGEKFELKDKKLKRVSVRFAWSSSFDANEYILQLSKLKDFTNPDFEKKTSGKWISVSVAPGEYFWRIGSTGKSGNSLWSAPRKVLVLEGESQGELSSFSPENKKNFYKGAKPYPVKFSWNFVDQRAHHRIQVATSRKFTKRSLVLDKTLDAVTISFPFSRTRKYFWRVKTFDLNEDKAEFSEVHEFEVIPKNRMKAPQIKSKILEFEVYNKPAVEEQKVSLSSSAPEHLPSVQLIWKKSEGVERYILEVSKSPKFEALFYTKEITGNKGTVRNLLPGTYYWRVKGIETEQLISSTSNVGTFVIKVKQINNLSSKEIIYSLDEKKYFKILWSRPSFGTKYELRYRFSNADKYRKRIVKKLEQNLLAPKDTTTIFFRIRPLNDEGVALGDFSPEFVQSISALPLAPPPFLILPEDNLEEIFYQSKYQKELSFSWKEVDDFKSYKIEFSKNKSFNEIYSSHTTNGLEFKYTLSEKIPSPLYWRVSVDSKKRLARPSDPRIFSHKKSKYLPAPYDLAATRKISDRKTARMVLAWKQEFKIKNFLVTIEKFDKDQYVRFARKMTSGENLALRLPVGEKYRYKVQGVKPIKDKYKALSTPSEYFEFNAHYEDFWDISMVVGMNSMSMEQKTDVDLATPPAGTGEGGGFIYGGRIDYWSHFLKGNFGIRLETQYRTHEIDYAKKDGTTTLGVSESEVIYSGDLLIRSWNKPRWDISFLLGMRMYTTIVLLSENSIDSLQKNSETAAAEGILLNWEFFDNLRFTTRANIYQAFSDFGNVFYEFELGLRYSFANGYWMEVDGMYYNNSVKIEVDVANVIKESNVSNRNQSYFLRFGVVF